MFGTQFILNTKNCGFKTKKEIMEESRVYRQFRVSGRRQEIPQNPSNAEKFRFDYKIHRINAAQTAGRI